MQALHAVEGHPAAIFQQGHHAARGRVVFLRADSRRRLGREDLAAQIAPQLLKFVNRGLDRRLAHQTHQHAGPARLVNRALLALRTRIARLQRFVTHHNLFRAGVGVGPVAAVALARAFLRFFSVRCRNWFRLGRGSGHRLWRRRLRILAVADHGVGLLRLRAEKQLPQTSDRCVLVVHQLGDGVVGVHHRPENRIVLLVKSFLGSPQSVFQLGHVDLDGRNFRWHDDTSNGRRRTPLRRSFHAGVE